MSENFVPIFNLNLKYANQQTPDEKGFEQPEYLTQQRLLRVKYTVSDISAS